MSISVQCPRCNGAVSISEAAAGKRVQCPHCESSFLAPGLTPTASDDDDWLNLDEVPLAPSPSTKADPPKSNKPPTTASPSDFPATPPIPASSAVTPSGPSLSDEDEALLAEFTEDLDGFTLDVEPLPAADPLTSNDPLAADPLSSDPLASDPFATDPLDLSATSALPGAKSPSPPKPKATPKQATPTEYATEYRVRCKVCDTLLYVKAHQAGQTVKCSDCHSPVTVPPPPKVTKNTKVNIEDAETFQFEAAPTKTRGPDPFKKSAEDLLAEASREEEATTSPTYDDVPSVKEWVLNVFGIFRDIGVVGHWVILSALAGLPAAMAVSFESSMLMLGMFPLGFFVTVLVVSCGFAILNAVANEEEAVTDWPTLDPMNWFGQLFVVVAATALVVVPVWLMCMVVLGPTMASVAMTMFAIFALFPFVLLSMLDMNSVMIPFSPELARSITKSQEAWGGFYFSSGLLFTGLFLLILIAKGMGAFGVVVGITVAIGVTFAYFAMIGRLAFAIGQGVNAPPREDIVDRTRKSEAN